MEGAHYMIKLAKDTSGRNLWLEGDSRNIINILNNKHDPAWNISNILSESKEGLNFFHNVFISHNYCEKNILADWMANMAIQSNDIITWTDQLSMDDVLRAKGN